MYSKLTRLKPYLSFLLLLALCLGLGSDSYATEDLSSENQTSKTSQIIDSLIDQVGDKDKTAILHPGSPNLITQAVVLSALALMPFIVMLLTSFVKIVIVLSLLRNALGAQQAPPNQVVNGIAMLLTLYIMYPTGLLMYEEARPVIENREIQKTELLSVGTAEYVLEFFDRAKEPYRDFMIRNSNPKHRAGFHRIAYRLLPPESRDILQTTDFIILVPSFITGQLKAAFEIGVLIYIPFFVVDLVTSNILLAMGMMMLSPVTISMPLKLFLLVMLDGWTLLVQGLVGTFH